MSENDITSIVHRGIRYRVGDSFEVPLSAVSANDIKKLKLDDTVIITIHSIKDDSIGMSSSIVVPGWHTLDGEVEPGHGYYLQIGTLAKLAETFSKKETIIKEDVFFKNRNLKGMSCLPLRRIDGGDLYFVELSENVGAGGADGLGKMGHCVLVPTNKLETKKITKTNKEKKKNE
jgi:hypothetical protein